MNSEPLPKNGNNRAAHLHLKPRSLGDHTQTVYHIVDHSSQYSWSLLGQIFGIRSILPLIEIS